MKILYLFFHQDELDEVLRSLKNLVIPKYKRYRFSEVVAAADGVLVGKYREMIFVATSKPVNIPIEEVGSVELEICDVEGKSFGFGSYIFGENYVKVSAEFSDELFYDYIPSFFAEITKARVVLKDCLIQAEALSREETEIIGEITRLSEEAKDAAVEKLENLVFEISKLRMDFFRKFMKFKDVVENVFVSIAAAEHISNLIGGFAVEAVNEARRGVELLHYYESKFQQTLSGVSDVLQVVSIRLDMLRNRETLELQKRTSSLQAAAAIIEFVAVYYYTLKIWESFLPVENMPKVVTFTLLAAFTTIVVIYTEAMGEYIRTRILSRKFAALTAALLLVLFLMVAMPILFSAAVQP